VALSNTTLGALLASINASIMLIALPDVFRGIGVNPLQPGNGSLLLWLILGYLVVTAVLVASFGRPGDEAGRVWIYNLGLVVFTVAPGVRGVGSVRGLRHGLGLPDAA